MIIDVLNTIPSWSITLLEFGCGSGRLLHALAQLSHLKIKYIWVDLSEKLLWFAKKEFTDLGSPSHITPTFVCENILTYIPKLSQESVDVVVWIASFQHIPTTKDRFFLLKNIYRILRYDGLLIMINWAFSVWFLKTYTSSLLRGLFGSIFGWKQRSRNDLFIPWKRKLRFYHIFTLKELRHLLQMSWFVITTLHYIAKWQPVSSRTQAQNSFVIAKKSVFLKNEVI